MLSGVSVLEGAQREVRQPTCLEKAREASAMSLWKSGTTTWQLTATRCITATISGAIWFEWQGFSLNMFLLSLHISFAGRCQAGCC